MEVTYRLGDSGRFRASNYTLKDSGRHPDGQNCVGAGAEAGAGGDADDGPRGCTGEAEPSEYEYTVAPKSGSSFVSGDDASTMFFTSNPLTRAEGNDVGEYEFSLVAAPVVRGGNQGEVRVRGGGGCEVHDHEEGSDGGGRGADEGVRRRHGDHGSDAERRRGERGGEQPEPDVEGDRGGRTRTATWAGNITIDSPTFDLEAGANTDKDNYALPSSISLAGTITKKTITDIGGVTVEERPVDGTTAASFDTTQATGAGVVSTELAGFRSG